MTPNSFPTLYCVTCPSLLLMKWQRIKPMMFFLKIKTFPVFALFLQKKTWLSPFARVWGFLSGAVVLRMGLLITCNIPYYYSRLMFLFLVMV